MEVLEDYRINGCEEHEVVRGYRPNIDYNPIFIMAADSYRMVELIESGVVAEFVQSSGMQCGEYGGVVLYAKRRRNRPDPNYRCIQLLIDNPL